MSHQSELISQDILAYLKLHEQKDLLRFLTCGNVDDGKSTLIGRLLYDSKMIYEDQLQAVTRDSKKVGTTGDAPDLALLVDGLQAEREQGITIDVAYRYFSTEKRKFIIADTPGHEQYTRNMATGASTCDLAIILIDARHGVQTQTRRHSYIAALLGIKHLVIAVNKMDLMDYSESRFNEIQADYLEFTKQLGERVPTDIRFVPMSALNGDNVVNVSAHTPWYQINGNQGATLMSILESVQINRDTRQKDFRFPVQYVNRPHLDFRGFAGTVALGSVRPGDEIVSLPSGKRSRIKDIVTYDGHLEQAVAGQAVTLTLTDEIDISRGNMITHADALPQISQAVRATVVWMTEQPLVKGKLYNIKVGTQNVPAVVSAINYRIDVNSLARNTAEQVELNGIADVVIEFNAPIVFDHYLDSRHTGSFIFIDRLSNVTIGAGMIEECVQQSNQQHAVTSEERAARLGQKPAVLGLPQQLIQHGEALERLLLQTGVVALVKSNLTDTEIALLRSTGIAVLVGEQAQADSRVTATGIEQAVEQIVEFVRL